MNIKRDDAAIVWFAVLLVFVAQGSRKEKACRLILRGARRVLTLGEWGF